MARKFSPPDVFSAAKTLLCFLQIFIVSNRDQTCHFAFAA
jgi:hypothetical protein